MLEKALLLVDSCGTIIIRPDGLMTQGLVHNDGAYCDNDKPTHAFLPLYPFFSYFTSIMFSLVLVYCSSFQTVGPILSSGS